MTAQPTLSFLLLLFATHAALGQTTAVPTERAESAQSAIAPANPQATAGAQPTAPATSTATEEPDSEARQQARQRFETGMKLYEEGDYALALLEFERAHSLVPGFRVLYNIGQVNIQLGRYARATRKLQQYLAEGADQIPPDRKVAVLADLEMLAGRTAHLQVVVNVAGAEISLDNDVMASSPMTDPILVDAGEHRITVRKAGYLEVTRPVALAGRDQLRLDINLIELPRSAATERTVILERPANFDDGAADRRRQLLLTLGWSGTGLFAVAWGATGYMGFTTAQKRKDELDAMTTADDLARLKRQARNWYIAADICGGLTIAAAATMAYYTFTPRPKAQPRIELGLAPGAVLVNGRF